MSSSIGSATQPETVATPDRSRAASTSAGRSAGSMRMSFFSGVGPVGPRQRVLGGARAAHRTGSHPQVRRAVLVGQHRGAQPRVGHQVADRPAMEDHVAVGQQDRLAEPVEVNGESCPRAAP